MKTRRAIEETGVPELLDICVKLLRVSGRGQIILMSSHKHPFEELAHKPKGYIKRVNVL